MTTSGIYVTGTGAASQAGTPVSQIPLVSGAELYAEPSVTGLNTQPVDDHCALALLGSNQAGPGVVDLEDLCTRLLSEGSVALVRNDLLESGTGASPVAIQEGRPSAPARAPKDAVPSSVTGDGAGTGFALLSGLLTLDPALPFTSTRFAQQFWAKVDGASQCVTRVFSLSGGRPVGLPAQRSGAVGEQARRVVHTLQDLPESWSVKDYTGFGTDAVKQIAQATAPADAIVAYPGGLGILYRAQRAYRRLEAIFGTIERLQSGVNAKTIISGYIGSAEQAHAELRRPDRDVALFPAGAEVHRVASTSAIDQLMREFDTLLPLYLRRLHFVHIEAEGQLSGVSRRLAMAPMLAFVEKTRAQLAEVVRLCGGTLSFDPAPWQRVVGKKSV